MLTATSADHSQGGLAAPQKQEGGLLFLSPPWGPRGHEEVSCPVPDLSDVAPLKSWVAGWGWQAWEEVAKPYLKLLFTPPFSPYYHLVGKVLLHLVYRWGDRLRDIGSCQESNPSGMTQPEPLKALALSPHPT